MDPIQFAERVFALRRALRISQGELAKRADISRNYVSLIERGEAQNVSHNVINQLAAALETSPAELTGESQQSQLMIPPALREFGIQAGLSFELVDRLARIPRRGQEPQSPQEWAELFEAVRPYLE